MRLDKFLKESRIIKRRTVAKEVVSQGKIYVNDREVKPSYEVKIGDIITIDSFRGISKFEVLSLNKKDESYVRIINE